MSFMNSKEIRGLDSVMVSNLNLEYDICVVFYYDDAGILYGVWEEEEDHQ